MTTLTRDQQEARLKAAWNSYRKQEAKHGQTSREALTVLKQIKRWEREDANY